MKLRAFLTKSTPLVSLFTMARQGNISPAYMFVCEDETLLDEAVATFIAQRIIKHIRRTARRLRRLKELL